MGSQYIYSKQCIHSIILTICVNKQFLHYMFGGGGGLGGATGCWPQGHK